MSIYNWIQEKLFDDYEEWRLKCPDYNRNGFNIVGIDNTLKAMHDGFFMYIELYPPHAIDGCTAMKARVGKTPDAVDLFLDIDGKTYRLSDYKGKKVYLKFWASWCSICLASLPDTDEIAKDAGDDYVVLTVVSPGHKGEQAEADFKNWYKGLDYKNLPVLIDPSGKLLESYGVRSYPTQAFIDKEGKLVKTQPGFMDKDMILKTLKEMG